MSAPSSWINGRLVTTRGDTHRVINPATGTTVAELSLATPDDADAAVAAARAAGPGWACSTPADRAAVLAKLAAAMAANADTLVAEEVSQTGKPVRLASEFDVPGSIDNVEFFAGAARHLDGKATAEYSPDHTSSIRREAAGVVATGLLAVTAVPTALATWPHRAERVEAGGLAAAADYCRALEPGDVVLAVDPQSTTLLDYHRSPHRRATNGAPGAGDDVDILEKAALQPQQPDDEREEPSAEEQDQGAPDRFAPQVQVVGDDAHAWPFR